MAKKSAVENIKSDLASVASRLHTLSNQELEGVFSTDVPLESLQPIRRATAKEKQEIKKIAAALKKERETKDKFTTKDARAAHRALQGIADKMGIREELEAYHDCVGKYVVEGDVK